MNPVALFRPSRSALDAVWNETRHRFETRRCEAAQHKATMTRLSARIDAAKAERARLLLELENTHERLCREHGLKYAPGQATTEFNAKCGIK